ncbi:hypothetical protein BJX70DRAFT_374830 [Aspergillus crustosus]
MTCIQPYFLVYYLIVPPPIGSFVCSDTGWLIQSLSLEVSESNSSGRQRQEPTT